MKVLKQDRHPGECMCSKGCQYKADPTRDTYDEELESGEWGMASNSEGSASGSVLVVSNDASSTKSEDKNRR